MTITSKQPNIGTTIFTVMSQLAAETGALNLSQGFPNYNCSPKLIELVNHYMHKGMNQYAPMAGIMPLREILAQKTADLYGLYYQPAEEITIVSGCTEAIYATMAAILHKDDEVIVFEPAYDSYVPSIELNGGKAIYVTLTAENDFTIDWTIVKSKITERTKAIMLTTPHNPTGKCLTKEDLNHLAILVKETNIFIVSDEVYEHIIFDNRLHLSPASHPALKERTFLCGSFGKTFHTTGWKLGYCMAPKELTAEFRKTHQWITFASPTPMQHAFADFMKEPDNYLSVRGFYEEKRNKFINWLKDSRFTLKPAEGSFFQMVSYTQITNEPDYDLAVRWTKEIGVASIPISVFYNQRNDNKILRFCFAKDDEMLEKAAERLCRL
ncbi:methionine aminotransferase [Emticicia sp. BO119]|uniref:methionine aminotransferase n=1 Tax=Emticicia sp. BO119 TaxID=2757768 RepID=UPI0015F054CC|nr:methionine aminotransferase [Emticicia sp. BO119]MBA4853523.1 aminotransferase class I/II-fold pyridoxal phosphate-dependent enzyme [Emticicia sp. BO119]